MIQKKEWLYNLYPVHPGKHLLLLYWLCQSLWLCGSPQTIENSITSDMQMTSPFHPYGRKWRTEEPLMKVKEESEKAGFKLNIQKTNIMASGPISSVQFIMASRWGNTGNREILCVLGLQNHCRWWLQPWNWKTLLLGRKAMTNLDSILKSRDITLPTKVHRVKDMVLPKIVSGCESWTIK